MRPPSRPEARKWGGLPASTRALHCIRLGWPRSSLLFRTSCGQPPLSTDELVCDEVSPGLRPYLIRTSAVVEEQYQGTKFNPAPVLHHSPNPTQAAARNLRTANRLLPTSSKVPSVSNLLCPGNRSLSPRSGGRIPSTPPTLPPSPPRTSRALLLSTSRGEAHDDLRLADVDEARSCLKNQERDDFGARRLAHRYPIRRQ